MYRMMIKMTLCDHWCWEERRVTQDGTMRDWTTKRNERRGDRRDAERPDGEREWVEGTYRQFPDNLPSFFSRHSSLFILFMSGPNNFSFHVQFYSVTFPF
jgi:hypothetical protein